MTDIDITTPAGRAELRKLVERATPTPWATKRWQTQYGHVTHVLSTRESELRPGLTGQEVIAANAAGFDAELLVAAVNALPALLDALDKAEQRGSRLFRVATRHKKRADDYKRSIDRVRALHQPAPNSCSALYPEPLCRGCAVDYPCDTVRALDGAQ